MRLFHYLYAKINGYFWQPCPICGENFGGHQFTKYSYPTAPFEGKACCPKPACQQKAKKAWEHFNGITYVD
jgi:hypothetical protein